MSKQTRSKGRLPFGFSPQQANRLQRILDTNGRRPSELAEEWGISISAANQDVARMRAKAGARSMAELLTIAQRAGIIRLTGEPSSYGTEIAIARGEDVLLTTSPENVYHRVLDSISILIYNVPVLPFTKISRTSMIGGEHVIMDDLSLRTHTIPSRQAEQALSGELRRIDDPSLRAECDARRESNNGIAIAAGLPAVGSRMLNKYGIEWVVEGHVHVPTPGTVYRWRLGAVDQSDDLYPSVVPQNLSSRLTSFMSSVDRCTTKTFILLDTTPELRPTAAPGSHSLDTISNAGTNLMFLDAARLHETVLAHEIGHAWVQYVEQCEDERVMEDVRENKRTMVALRT